MAKRENLVQQLKALAPRPAKEQRAFRVPKDVDDEIVKLAKETGATYTDTAVFLWRLGLEAFKKNPKG